MKDTRIQNNNDMSKTNSYDVFTMASAFLSISPMTNKKLQKLCYYAKAWYLALYDENIIDDQFQAWVHGAVQPALYDEYKEYGFDKIPQINEIDAIPEEFLSFANDVYEAYGHLTGNELEALNHEEDPWVNYSATSYRVVHLEVRCAKRRIDYE